MRRGIAAAIALMTSGCSQLGVFDALVPKDGGSRRVAHDAAFGDDPRQRLDLYAPKRRAGTLPVIVFIHGGSWNSGGKAGYAFLGRALAAQGFLVAVPDYRLVPQVRYPAFLQDNAAAVHWVRGNAARFGGDPARLVLMGHSAGAYGAAMLALDPRWLGADRAAVRGLIGLAGPYDFLPLDGPVTRAAFGAADDLPATQPVAHAGPGAPPALLATGDRDAVVRPRNSDALAAALSAHGVAVERRRYPRLGHVGVLLAIARPLRGRAPVLRDVAAFARRVAAPSG